MAATSPYFLNTSATVDTQIGLNGDLTGQLINSFSGSVERNEVEHMNYLGVPTVLIHNSPKATFQVEAAVLARTTGITNKGPGYAFNRSTLVQYRSGVEHELPLDSGWVVMGNVTHGQPRGDLDTISYSLRLFGFATTTSGTLASSGLS